MTAQSNTRIALRDDELCIEPVTAAGQRVLSAIYQGLASGDETGVEALARRHPELFRVHLGPDFGPNILCKVAQRASGERRMRMPTSGTFAMRLLTWGYDGAMKALLEQGLHPDDRTVFLDSSMLGHGRCRLSVGTTALALRHGADPNALGWFSGDKVEPVAHRCQFLFELRRRMTQVGGEPTTSPSTPLNRGVLLLLAEAGADLVVAGGYLPRSELVTRVRNAATVEELALANELLMQRSIRSQADAPAARPTPARRVKVL